MRLLFLPMVAGVAFACGTHSFSPLEDHEPTTSINTQALFSSNRSRTATSPYFHIKQALNQSGGVEALVERMRSRRVEIDLSEEAKDIANEDLEGLLHWHTPQATVDSLKSLSIRDGIKLSWDPAKIVSLGYLPRADRGEGGELQADGQKRIIVLNVKGRVITYPSAEAIAHFCIVLLGPFTKQEPTPSNPIGMVPKGNVYLGCEGMNP